MPPVIALAIIILLIILWIAVIAAMLLLIYGSVAIRVPFVPVAHYVVEALKEEAPLTAGDVFYDLGSGDGRAVLAMAKAYPDARAIGVEKGPFPYLVSRLRGFLARSRNASFLFKDFSKVPLFDATHVYLYLYPEVVQKLLPRLESELARGAQVIVCDFPFAARRARRELPVVHRGKKYTLYFYDF